MTALLAANALGFEPSAPYVETLVSASAPVSPAVPTLRLPAYHGNLGAEPEWSVDVPADWTPANLKRLAQAGMTALRVCVTGMPILINPDYAARIKTLVDAVHGLGMQIGLSIHDLRSIMSADNSIPPHDMTNQEAIDCLCALLAMGADWVDENEVHKFGDTVNQDWINHVVTVGLGVRAKYPDAELVLGLPVWSSSFQGDAVGIERRWGNGIVWDAVCKPFDEAGLRRYDVLDLHFYGLLADIPGLIPVKLAGKVRWKVGECHPGATWSASDGLILERTQPVPDADTFAILDALRAAGAESVSGWANVDNNEKIPLGLTKRTPVGAAMDAWNARQSVSLLWLNPMFYAQSPSASLRDGTDLFNYFQPTPDNPFHFDLNISMLSEAVKTKLRVDVESQQSAGNTTDYGGAGTDNRAVGDYAYYGSADGGKTWTLVPNVAAPAPLAFTPNPVVGTTKRWNCHWLDCAGFDTLRFACTKARGQQGDQFSVQFDFYDGSSCATQADFSRTDGVTLMWDSTGTFVVAFVENLSAMCATKEHPHPPIYPNGQPYIQAYNYLTNDLANYEEVINEKPGMWVFLGTGANDVPSPYWFASNDGLIAINRKAMKKTVVSLPLCPNGPLTDDGGAPYKVRTALLARYDPNGNVTTTGGVSLYEYLCVRYAGQADVLVSKALFEWSYNNPGVMNPNDLHEADYSGWRDVLAAEIRLRCFGSEGPAYVAPVPISPLAVATGAATASGMVSAPPVPAVGVASVGLPEAAGQAVTTTVATGTPNPTPPQATAVSIPESAPSAPAADLAAQARALLASAQSLAAQAAALFVTVTAQELAASGLVNTGQAGWTSNGTPAVTADASLTAGFGRIAEAAYISPNAGGQAGDGLYTFRLRFTASQAGTLRGIAAASEYVKSIVLNGNVQGGLPWIDWTTGKPFAAGGVIAGENTLEFGVQRDGAGTVALCVAFTPLA